MQVGKMFEVIEAGGLATVQDLGRMRWRRYGVPGSGPMDAYAFRAANLLAGNPADAAALEIGGGELVLRALYDCVIAVTGAGYGLSIYVWDFPLWSSYFVRGGWTVRLRQAGFGMWAYLAVCGGMEAAAVLGSRSTYLRGRFGGHEGRSLQAGDTQPGATSPQHLMEAAGRTVIEEARPPYHEAPTVDVILGPQHEHFTDEGLQTFLSSSYRVSTYSDRMGYRLDGPRLRPRGSADMISEGMAGGSIQVPADGNPIVMMADCATTGGYPKIASVISADLPLLAQCTPGKDEVRFRQTTVAAAQKKYRLMLEKLEMGVIKSEEDEHFGS